MKLIIRDEAREETINAYLWYEEQQADLGEVFLKDLDNCYLQGHFRQAGILPEKVPRNKACSA